MIQQNRNGHDEIARRLAETEDVTTALKRAARDAVEQHARAGRKIVVWRDQVVWEDADESTIEAEPVKVQQEIVTGGAKFQQKDSLVAIELLRKPDVSDRRRGILLAETLKVHGELRNELRERLQEFIEAHRDSNDSEDLVAVGAAIRKLIAMSDLHDLRCASVILKPSSRMSLPIEVELEVTKMIVRKLVANANTPPPPNEELSDLLFQIVETYANDRMLPRDKYGATTLNAILASVLLKSKHLDSIRGILGQLSATWFVRATVRRCRKLQRDILRSQPEACLAVTELNNFEESLSAI